jgi:hypothetical protein
LLPTPTRATRCCCECAGWLCVAGPAVPCVRRAVCSSAATRPVTRGPAHALIKSHAACRPRHPHRPTEAALQAFLRDMNLSADDLAKRPVLAKRLIAQHIILRSNGARVARPKRFACVLCVCVWVCVCVGVWVCVFCVCVWGGGGVVAPERVCVVGGADATPKCPLLAQRLCAQHSHPALRGVTHPHTCHTCCTQHTHDPPTSRACVTHATRHSTVPHPTVTRHTSCITHHTPHITRQRSA